MFEMIRGEKKMSEMEKEQRREKTVVSEWYFGNQNLDNSTRDFSKRAIENQNLNDSQHARTY